MELSRKSRRELRRLKRDAQDLLDEQRVVLGHAAVVAQAAGRQAKRLSDTHIAPGVNDALDTVRPTLNRGAAAARRAADNVRRLTTPIVASALANTISKLDELDSPEAAKQVRKFGERSGYLQPKKKRVGGTVAIVLGIAAAAGVGYVLWQAFRTDDDLWIAPEEVN